MNRANSATTISNKLDFHAAGFLVKGQGTWTDAALIQFRHFLKLRRLSPSEKQLQQSLRQAKLEYSNGAQRLYLCAAQPCCSKVRFDMSDAALKQLGEETGVAISKTGCQGPCKQAPILSLRIGDKQETFAQVAAESDWRAMLKFAKAAAQARTFLVDDSAAEKFRFDPVHDHGKPSAHLKPLEFLLGHFRGVGQYAMTDYAFQKEVVGSFEAGGRFVALRMDASYPLADGRKDVHKALVIVGAEATGSITAHAYTDGGLVRQYAIAHNPHRLEFADIPPGHASQWQRARKILQPTLDGFEERLEVDPGDGFVPYYVIAMRRQS